MGNQEPDAPPTTRRRRRWPWIALGVLALFNFAIVMAPRLAAPLVRSRIEAALERSLDAEATLEYLKLSWSGKVHATGLVVVDREGLPLLSAEALDARIAPLAAVRGAIHADAEARGIELHLRRDETGHWNLEDILRERERKPGEKKPPGTKRELPDLALDLALRASRIHVHDAATGTYTIGPIESTLALESVDAPAVVKLAAPLRAPSGTESSLRVDGSVTFARDGHIDPDAFAGHAEIALEDLPLAVAGDLGLLPGAIARLAGLADGTLTCRVDRARAGLPIAVQGILGTTDLDLAFAPSEPEGEPFVLHEDEVRLELDLGLDAAALDVDLERVHLASAALQGEVRGKFRNLRALAVESAAEPARAVGVEARFTYVPERIGALLGRWIPGSLSGSEPQPLTLFVDGPLTRGDPVALVAGLELRSDLRLADFESAGVHTRGDLGIVSDDGRAVLEGRFELNGGEVRIDGNVGLVPGASEASKIVLGLEGAEARGELAPLLGMLHPIFAGVSSSGTGTLEGLLSAGLELSWPGALPLRELSLGAEPIDWSKLSGQGNLSLSSARVSGSSLLDELLVLLGRPGQKEVSLQPLVFRIDAGRIAYAEPWSWKIAGLETSFGGSIGFDQSLDLTWTLPLTASFLKKQKLPKELAGQTLSLPIRGTIDHPELELDGVLDALAKTALEGELAGRVDELKEKLEESLGDLVGDELGGKIGDLTGKSGGDDPDELLKQADALWTEGKQAEAKPLYKRIREEFKLSPTYLLNRDRIKERAKD